MQTHRLEGIFIKPNIEPMSVHALRIRRNLITYSIITFCYSKSYNYIDIQGSSFLGIKFTRMPENLISYGLITATLYCLIYFFWSVSNQYYENKLRLTSIKVPMVSSQAQCSDGILEPNSDNNNDSTLLSWWVGRNKSYNQNPANEELNIENEYIKYALERFEKGFWHYQKSQCIKWIIIDLGLPISMGIISVGSMAIKLYY